MSPAKKKSPSDRKSSTAKKPASRKTAAKQTATRKTTTKRPAAKKSTRKKSAAKSPSPGAVPLAAYNAKRDFTITSEPAGTVSPTKTKQLHFVIQKHEASHLHYDFRLELDGVMKSWAVPKGPSLDPSVKRLAMEVEDHPISYNTFEGTIPQGEYGGGTVMLWDNGTYAAEDGGGAQSLRDGYARGDLKIVMDGKRLQGGFALVRMKRPGRPQWLLIKHRDAFSSAARDIVAENDTSVTTGRSMEEIAKGRRVWRSNR